MVLLLFSHPVQTFVRLSALDVLFSPSLRISRSAAARHHASVVLTLLIDCNRPDAVLGKVILTPRPVLRLGKLLDLAAVGNLSGFTIEIYLVSAVGFPPAECRCEIHDVSKDGAAILYGERRQLFCSIVHDCVFTSLRHKC
ncbi:hypothetical protein NP493_1824g00036 [Ridgeia piscesae]|uniref:Uncharacterized protein n=1 Tax=Ridgeia piscesae TaxID=27915 RepID=A0AAD9JSE6_RIDPI|nr:hypothetical protein NP493_1824g00036 [Ridgeia piscesae]